MKKIILISGWIWYIGSHWVVAFEQAWYKTVIVDNLSNSNIDTLNWIEKILGYKPDFFEVDLRDKNSLAKVFKKYNFDWVIHFAWLKSVWESCEKPLLYFDNNINWSVNLFEIMDKYKVKNIIFSSSATVYSSVNKLPLTEDSKLWTSNPYWTTKLLIENILEDLANFNQFNVINLRYFNPIWAHKSWYIWENPIWTPNNLLPYIMKVAKWELDKLEIFGWDYNTIDWTWVRDYIDVVDLIEWYLSSYRKIENDSENWFFEKYNLWVWKGVSVLEIINESEIVIWKKINYEIVGRRKWDIDEVYCDNQKAENELWFNTKISLEESLKNSWRFYNK